jgi:hypothetical protein
MTYARDLARLARQGALAVDTSQALRDLPVYDGVPPLAVITLGAISRGDGGGGLWRWQSARTDTDNTGTYLLPTGQSAATPGRWIRQREPQEVQAAWWGLKRDGATDNYAAIQAAIDYAAELAVSVVGYPANISVILPPGAHYISQGLLIATSGVSLYSDPGGGCELLGPGALITFGVVNDYGDRQQANGVYNLSLTSTDAGSTASIGVTLWRTTRLDIANCTFSNFHVCIDSIRSSTTLITGCRFDVRSRTTQPIAAIRLRGTDESNQPSASYYTPGGGMHITDCEIAGTIPGQEGVSAGKLAPYGVLVNSVDGLYIVNTHIVGCTVGLRIEPLATPECHAIEDVILTNVYFDAPAGLSNVARNCEIVGSVSENILVDDGTLQASSYNGISFNNCYFRGADWANHGLYIAVTDLDTWEQDDPTRQVEPVILTGCKLRRHLKQSIIMPAAGEIKMGSIIITGTYFEDYNEGFTITNSAAAISCRAKSFLLTGCVFRNQAAVNPAVNPSYIVLLLDPTNAATITGNDFTQAVAASQYIRLTPTDIENTVVIGLNTTPGYGRQAEFFYKKTTTDATTYNDILYTPSAGNGGFAKALITGQGPDGKVVTALYKSGYSKAMDNTLSFDTGTNSMGIDVPVWKPADVLTAPYVGKNTSGTAIRAFITGVAGQTWYWVVQLTLVEAT